MSKSDNQLVELAGRNWLTSQLLQAGLEVARPERDHGIDLIVYKDLDESGRFIAYPIQMKAATNGVFSLDPKYKKFSRLFLVYIWSLGDPSKTTAYALTYDEALNVADAMGYTKTKSWLTGGKRKRRGYSTTRPSRRLKELLVLYQMDSEKWLSLSERFLD